MYRLLPLAVAAVCFAAAVALPASSGDQATSPSPPLTRAPVPSQPRDLRINVTGDVMHATHRADAGGSGSLAPDVRAAVLEIVERYVELGSLEPIRHGRIGRGLQHVFGPEAFAHAADRDRGVLFDEHLPVDRTAAPHRAEVSLAGLTRPDGEPAVVVVRLVLEVRGRSGIRVERSAELTLVPAGDGWVVDAYTVRVVRRLPPAPPSDPVSASYQWLPGEPIFLLALGSDARAGLEGQRADAIHLVGVNAAAGKATIINFPRDTWVDIPGHRMSRINEAFDYGGAELQASTIANLTGIHPRAVLVTTFTGLPRMVDALGGIVVDVQQTHADRLSGAFFDAGPNFFEGHNALAYSRNRHIPGGDFARTANQAHLIIAALAKLRGDGASATNTAFYLSVLLQNTAVHGVGVVELFRLARVGLTLDPADVRSVTIPARGGWVGPRSVVFPVAPAADIIADFRDDAILQRF